MPSTSISPKFPVWGTGIISLVVLCVGLLVRKVKYVFIDVLSFLFPYFSLLKCLFQAPEGNAYGGGEGDGIFLQYFLAGKKGKEA